MWSLERKGIDAGKVATSQVPGTSKIGGEISSAESTEVTTDADILPRISFDKLHPPSPRVPQGGNMKKSKPSKESVILKMNESYSSSDVEMCLSGKVATRHTNITSDSQDDESGM